MSRKRRRRQIVTGVGVGAGATLLMGGTAQAAVFTVDSLQDVPDPGTTTLRDAIADAEKPADSGSTVTFASGLSGTITSAKPASGDRLSDHDSGAGRRARSRSAGGTSTRIF